MTERVQPDLVILLRRHHAAGKGVTYLARRFGLSRQTVNNIIRFKTHAKVVDIGEPLENFEPVSTKPRVKRPGPASADSLSHRLIKDPPTPAATPSLQPPSRFPQPPRGKGWESPREQFLAARARDRVSQEMAAKTEPGDVDTEPPRREPEPDVQPEPSPAPPRRPSTGGYSARAAFKGLKGGF